MLSRALCAVWLFLAFVSQKPLDADPSSNLSVSVIVPCHYVHFQLVPELLSFLAEQTSLPEEVVISVSEASKIPLDSMTAVQNKYWPFLLTILSTDEKLSAGQNRNKACSVASGDLFIYQDADDIPHPQRVELIRSLFKSNDIEHLMHFWILPHDSFDFYKPEKIQDLFELTHNYERAVNYYEEIPNYGHVTNGNIAILRKIYEKISWPTLTTGEDESFNRSVYAAGYKTAVLKAPLLIYRNQFSSFHSSTAPYISGNAFRAHADFIIDEVHLPFSPSKVKEGDIIFVKTDYLSRFFYHLHPLIPAPYILITHNSPLSIPGPFAPFLDDEKLLAWFGCNVESISHPKLHPIPVGIANAQNKEGIDIFGRAQEKQTSLNRELLLSISISENSDIEDFSYLGLQPYCSISLFKNRETYLEELKNSTFTLCSLENGFDCHCIWEALYMQTIPIIQAPFLPRVFQGLPIISITDINEITESFLKYHESILNFQPNLSEKLDFAFWQNEINQYKNGIKSKL